jgi:hypothetical protein
MPLIGKVQKGQAITADMMNNIIDSIRECQIQSVVGGVFRRGVGGTTITIASGRGGGGAVAQTCPFDITVTPVTSGYNVSFLAGTVNGLLPTNMFEPFTNVTTASVNYFYIKCTSDGKLITSTVIEKDTSVRTPQASNIDTAPSLLNILIGYMTTAGQAFKTIPCNNITAKIYPTIQEDNVTYVGGERNFKQYYNWGT